MGTDLRILYVTSYAPSTERPRAYNILRGLARHFRVSLVCQVRSAQERQAAERMLPHCDFVEAVTLSRWRAWANCLLRLPSSVPLRAAYFHNPKVRRAIAHRLAVERYDLVHVEHMMAAHFVADLRGVLRSFDTLDSIARLQRKILHGARNPLARLVSVEELLKLRRYEPALCRHFDCVLTSTELDREALGVPGVRVVPNGVDMDYYRPSDETPEADTILFYGRLSYIANADAIGYFLREVFPRIVAARPSARLFIVGPSAPKRVLRAASHNITVTGRVEDVRAYLRRARLVVCPVRFAVGTQNKILEPMAMGVPVVATSEATASLAVEPNRHLLLGNSPGEFAEQVVRLLDDDALRALIARRALEYVQKHHDWRAIVDELAGFYAELVEAQGRATS